MSELEAILLGVVQGATEFLPISSSGHLILVPWLFDIEYLEQHPLFNKTFDVALHLGTLLAVVAYFRVEVKGLISGLVTITKSRRVQTAAERLTVAVVIATVPAVLVGYFGEDFIDRKLGEPWQIAIMLAVFGVVLAVADRCSSDKTFDDISTRDAIKIGIAQAVALIPGVSRSGITISAGRFLGLDRDSAARFSFLLLLPATAGAVVVKGVGVAQDGLPPGSTGPLVAGVIASAISGFLAIAWLLSYVRRRNYDVFVLYRLLAAAVILILIASGIKSATF